MQIDECYYKMLSCEEYFSSLSVVLRTVSVAKWANTLS